MSAVLRIASDSKECAKQNSLDGVNRNTIGNLLQRDRRSFGATRRGVGGCGIAIRVRPANNARMGSAPGKARQRGGARKERSRFCAFRVSRSRGLQDLPRGHLQRLGEESALEDQARYERRSVAPG